MYTTHCFFSVHFSVIASKNCSSDNVKRFFLFLFLTAKICREYIDFYNNFKYCGVHSVKGAKD